MTDPGQELSLHRAPEGLLEGALHARARRNQRRAVLAAAAASLLVGLVGGWVLNEAFAPPPTAVTVVTPASAEGPVAVRLVLHAPEAMDVRVAGTFNDWEAEQTPLTRGPDGLWHTVIELPRGRYEYQFVLDGSRWMADPVAELSVPDDFGQQNAVLDV